MHRTMKEKVKEYTEKMSKLIPSFEEHWYSDDACFNFGEESSIYGVFSDFSTLVIDRLKNNHLTNAEQVFSFIESVVVLGGDEANAACICFLENILNLVPNEIEPKTFVPFLGQKSRKFCRDYDIFTGVKTNGLH